VKGKVTDLVGHPKEGVKVVLRNHFFKGAYESYAPSEKQVTYTDVNGEYLFKLAQSTWIHVDTTDQTPSPVFQARYTNHFRKTMRFDFILNKSKPQVRTHWKMKKSA
jgi:hypothetical protein